MKLAILDAKTLGDDIDLNIFRDFGYIEIYPITKTKEETIERVKDKNIIITNKVIIDKDVMDNAPYLKLICVAATGYNNVDINYAKQKGIAVTNVAGYSTNSVVQHTFAMLFYLLENLRYYDDYVKSGEYSKSPIFTHLDRPFWELNGKTWGVIGLGTIGKKVAQVAESFGCDVIYYSTSGKNLDQTYPHKGLDELLSISDIVSIHAPLNEYTKNLITYDKIKLMKKTAILLNLGRGGIVNERDLAKALDEGLIAAAGLDVLEKEPIDPDNPLLFIKNKDRLLITPHIAWTSIEARQTLVKEIYLNIEAFIRGKQRNRVC
ncbi:glycerate dehydrogenase (NADH-dependent hydroxypyruvatereductase) (hpr) (gdh) (hydroxypyruvate dehydrogenase) (glyoxylatereductase) (hpr-a) [Sulfurihydrogenibium azorense Az-Fu1]|jgi:glycerate dehydrogenase|uniref:Glycerate dehydrogenase (NADH-dependent hydroxypyruvatereductase) (Hpr) (Gdh) (Hydroxypyruvate dehydrogenase) (Glyoxylatereductase) (Hpr-a) n=1 Tax=Sulfurihydrogenibium azorense (strain DSM 15241 / OCM 825 / Az-Fu1) TaxID=204536 RepID=C1DXV3_SULAA|nr:D-2-hydroxyacid dehydrogenase [Sulfurihydrogenibium azorense]ACN98246.1 glycerate dehydrogenase (NADH-dependent hydroxypyruvatereductase) (hpr) (gdh) (hydroxypyruvate dehydrogenase) (glyoxylatereductase) (hpr-a) [Sulfurihydrogenibium azorense Az-Fu1]